MFGLALTIAPLKLWNEREVTQMELADDINRQLSGLPGARVRIRQESSLDVGGGGSGLEVALLGNEYEEISAAADTLTRALLDRVSEIDDIRIQFDTSQPELSFNIDREKANDLNVPMERISQTLRVMVNQYDLLDLSVEDQAVPLIVGSAKGAVDDPGDLLNIFVTNIKI